MLLMSFYCSTNHSNIKITALLTLLFALDIRGSFLLDSGMMGAQRGARDLLILIAPFMIDFTMVCNQ